jgi:hypothetical protein
MSQSSSAEPSLCIPRVFSNITWQRVKETLERAGLGTIDRVDMIHKTNEKGEKFKRVFVHFKRWSSEREAQLLRDRIMDGEEVKIVYDDPWFWKVYKSHVPRPERTTRTSSSTTHRKSSSRDSRDSRDYRQRSAPRPKVVVGSGGSCSGTSSSSPSGEVDKLRRLIEAEKLIALQKRELEQLKAQLGVVEDIVGEADAETETGTGDDGEKVATPTAAEMNMDKLQGAKPVADWASPDEED